MTSMEGGLIQYMLLTLLFHQFALAIKTADGVKPFSFKVFFMSASPYCFLGKVDENRTDPTSYVMSSEQTHSATSTNARSSARSHVDIGW